MVDIRPVPTSLRSLFVHKSKIDEMKHGTAVDSVHTLSTNTSEDPNFFLSSF